MGGIEISNSKFASKSRMSNNVYFKFEIVIDKNQPLSVINAIIAVIGELFNHVMYYIYIRKS